MPTTNVIVQGVPATSVEIVNDNDTILLAGTPDNALELTAPVTNVVTIGIQGPEGPAGDGDLNYVHNQGSANATWVITHSLGKLPSITIVDSSNREVIGDIVHDSINQATISFSSAFAGKAYVN